MRNLLALCDLEVVSLTDRILMPKKIPLLGIFLNGLVANLWPFKYLCLTYWIVARPRPRDARPPAGVSVICPCRNEVAMIARIVDEVPEMGAGTEIVFVDDGSTDGTGDEIRRQIELHPERDVTLVSQTGLGKAAAVRAGFAAAKNEILMILDADLTVPSEGPAPFLRRPRRRARGADQRITARLRPRPRVDALLQRRRQQAVLARLHGRSSASPSRTRSAAPRRCSARTGTASTPAAATSATSTAGATSTCCSAPRSSTCASSICPSATTRAPRESRRWPAFATGG